MIGARSPTPLLGRYGLRAALLFGAFGLRALQNGRESLWRDEIDSIRFALAPWPAPLEAFAKAGENGPLYHLILRGWLSLGGTSDLALRLFSTLCGMLLLAVIYALGRRLLGPRAAGWATAFAALSPALVWYAGEGKMYALQPLLITLALLAVARRRWIWFGLAALAAMYVHVLSPLFLPVAVVLVWATRRPGERFPWAALAAGAAVALPLAIPLLPVVLRGADFGHPVVAIDGVVSRLLSLWAFGVARPSDVGLPDALADIAGLIAAGLAAWGAARLASRPATALLAWMAIPAGLLMLLSSRVPLFEPRYLLWAAPALYLLLGALLAGLRGPIRAILAGALGLIACAGLYAQAAAPIRPDLRGAAALARDGHKPNDAIVYVMPYARYAIDHYLGDLPRTDVDGGYTNGGLGPVRDSPLPAAVLRAPQIWLIETEAWQWDVDGLNRAWLDAHATRMETYALHGVIVTRYISDRIVPKGFLPMVER
ncbi:MAG: glycosyltransferase family 39 protein [Anaerolineae bacterium]|nr:glycosyltransferase family 39 protein [Anaerolineae bacterium]